MSSTWTQSLPLQPVCQGLEFLARYPHTWHKPWLLSKINHLWRFFNIIMCQFQPWIRPFSLSKAYRIKIVPVLQNFKSSPTYYSGNVFSWVLGSVLRLLDGQYIFQFWGQGRGGPICENFHFASGKVHWIKYRKGLHGGWQFRLFYHAGVLSSGQK